MKPNRTFVIVPQINTIKDNHPPSKWRRVEVTLEMHTIASSDEEAIENCRNIISNHGKEISLAKSGAVLHGYSHDQSCKDTDVYWSMPDLNLEPTS